MLGWLGARGWINGAYANVILLKRARFSVFAEGEAALFPARCGLGFLTTRRWADCKPPGDRSVRSRGASLGCCEKGAVARVASATRFRARGKGQEPPCNNDASASAVDWTSDSATRFRGRSRGLGGFWARNTSERRRPPEAAFGASQDRRGGSI